ncbi:alpha/beta hydrolase [Luteitalea sp.]|uniref:alpha/beta hydrolase n=1 Tax=Luteitalea sp. TaxID=2004800 RepID=UPI0025BB098B|nr:alpha/beta hydrolase [Luteitalea sp.]
MRTSLPVVLLASLVMSTPAAAQGPATGSLVPLWTGPVPLATGTGPEDTPALTVYRPAPGTATGAAFVVLPGGGYRGRAAHEGEPIAQWLNSLGVTAFVARYRVSPYRHPAPLTDALRAVRYVRAHAREWGLDGRVGILGFSAGGHLASTAATQFTEGDPAAVDPVERVSSRPDLAVLIYPVITFTEDAWVHKGSRTNLLGEGATAEQMAAMSSERRVTARTPPVFLLHTTADAAVPPENSLLFAQAMRKAGVEVELHLFEGGRHGFGLGEKEGPIGTWPLLAGLWLHKHDFARETTVSAKE